MSELIRMTWTQYVGKMKTLWKLKLVVHVITLGIKN